MKSVSLSSVHAVDSSNSQQVNLPPDAVLQIQRILSDRQASRQDVDEHFASWTESKSLESQIDGLLSQHRPLSLASVDRVHARLRTEIRSCEAKIEQMTAELETEIDPERMSQVQSAIGTLLEQLHLIREKARESENVVKEITRDIRSLDIAKRNIVGSMTALKRLQMLVNGIDQLERLAETKRYREAASALQAVRSLLDFFQSYRSVERIASAWRQVNDLQVQLRASVRNEYEQFFLHDPGRPVRSTNLSESALVVDAIGPEARAALIEWYCSLQLREYRRIFRATDEAGQLDNVSRRFAWFRRILKTYEDEHASAFLEDWKVERWLIRRFTEITKEDIRSVLIREQSRLNVATLIEALNSTLEFEAAVSRKYGTPFDELISPPVHQQTPPPHPKRGSSSEAAPPPPPKQPVQTLSSIFDPYLTIFVEAQDRTLSEMLVQYRRQGARLSHDGSSDPHQTGGFGAEGAFGPASATDSAATATGATTVLPSSTEMFYFYRQTLEQCARLSNREPFRDLCEVYKKWLRVYAEDVLRASLVRSEPVRRSMDIRPNTTEIQKWCLVLNTADYCASTSSQLEDKLREKIHPDFKEGITFEDERGIFLTVIAYTVQTLARELELCSEPIWNTMLRPQLAWSQIQGSPTGKSQYIAELASLLEQFGVVVRQDVENKRYVRSWCDKIVAVLTSRFINNLVRLRPIGSFTAEQLLLDISELRKILVELPRYPVDELAFGVGGRSGGDESLSHWMPAPTPQQTALSSAAASYLRYVNRLTDRIELLLKLVLAPVDVEDSADSEKDLVHTYIDLIADRSISNFQKVLDLKGVHKVEQNVLLDEFVKITSAIDGGCDAPTSHGDTETRGAAETGAAGDRLADQSLLTQLDMDPPNQPLLQSPFNAAVPSFLDGARRNSSHLVSATRSTIFGQDSLRSPTSTPQGPGEPASTGAGRAFSDLRKFGNFFGAALGRREDGRGR